MNAKGLQLIPVSADRVVLKRGVNELLLTGPAVHSLVEPLLGMLDEGCSRDQIVESFPVNVQDDVRDLFKKLLERRLISQHPEPTPLNGDGDGWSSLRESFWWNFGEPGERAPSRLAAATIFIVGVNLVSRALVRSLLEMKLGRVTVVAHPILDNHIAPWDERAIITDTSRLQWSSTMPSEVELEESALLCAACDFGSPDVMVEMNRLALRVNRPFLPVWLSDLMGYVGPLNYPFETACLRCYQVRGDSNNRDFEATRAVRQYVARDPDLRYGAGFLPPMAGAVGEIAAMEIIKCLTGVAPPDTIAHLIEINLVSFASSVRRVLKIPRCPDCSETMQHASRAITTGSLIPSE